MKKFKLNVPERKELVTRLVDLTGQRARYTFMPRCAYEVGGYSVEKDGDVRMRDDNGRVVEERYLDANGDPVARYGDYYGLSYEYDETSTVITYLDAEGNPIILSDGYSIIVRTQVGGQRIEMPCGAFCRGIIRLEVYCQICALRHAVSLPFRGGFRNGICLLFQVP